jgi:4-carboxymuconolactone decarboxylase
MSSAYDEGMRVRAEVLGAEHVARAQAQTTELDADFQRFITETAWGSLWARPDLDRRTRSLITIGLLAALGRERELGLHLRASRNTGASPREIAEVLLHVAVYAGVPAANSAMAMLKAEFGAATASAQSGEPA